MGPGVRRDDERARLAPRHLPNIQNRIRKTRRILLRRIMADTLEHAPLVLRTEMLPVLFGILHRVHPVDGAVNIDGRDGNLWLLSQSCLDAGITRIARRVLHAVPIGLDDDIDKIFVGKRARGPLKRRVIERPAGRPQFPEQLAKFAAVFAKPVSSALGMEIILIPEPQFLRWLSRYLRAGDVLDVVSGATAEPEHPFRPQRRNDARRAAAPVESGEYRALDFQRIEQFEKVLAQRGLLAGSRRVRRK